MNCEIDISNVTLKTERLILRPWRESDLDDFNEYASVPGVGEMAGWHHHRSREESAEILGRFIDHKRTFALELKDALYGIPGSRPGKVIGSLGIETYDEELFPEYADKRCREIGYVLSKDYWGRGLMAEAVKEALRYVFEDLDLDAAFCGHYMWNTQSGRVQEKCGFRFLHRGTRMSSLGSMEDHEYNIMTAADYRLRLKSINTGSVSYLELLEDGLYWGTDHASGDLYEAEELYDGGRGIKSNRLIFVSLKDGRTYEPLKAEEGQYFGKPVLWEGRVYVLKADFKSRSIEILRLGEGFSGAEPAAELSLDEVPDCYNLMLDTEPLTLVRQGHDNDFQVVWPDKASFSIDSTESFDFRDGDVLVFAKWFEDPDYREETVLRKYPDGEVIETLRGPVMKGPGGSKWLLWDGSGKQAGQP